MNYSDIFNLLVILITGFFTGFINTIAGGGSLISLPVLIFMGLDSNVANASNRIGILFQSLSAIKGFQSKGISAYPYSLYLGISSSFGALLGAKIAVDIKDETFNDILAIVMILVAISMAFQTPKTSVNIPEKMSLKTQLIGVAIFFFVGIYGGFLQAGVGFIMILTLTSLNGFTLAKTNSAKVFIVAVYTCVALVVFAYKGIINWKYGLLLAVGNTLGGWIASRWSVEAGDVWVKCFIIIAIVALAIKLLFL